MGRRATSQPIVKSIKVYINGKANMFLLDKNEQFADPSQIKKFLNYYSKHSVRPSYPSAKNSSEIPNDQADIDNNVDLNTSKFSIASFPLISVDNMIRPFTGFNASSVIIISNDSIYDSTNPCPHYNCIKI